MAHSSAALRYPQADQLVSVGVIAPIIDGEFLFAANYLAWRRDQTPFASFTSSTGVNDCDLTDDRPVRSTCAAVASTFLPTFGVQPILGRNFTPEEDRPDSPRVALLSYGLMAKPVWRRPRALSIARFRLMEDRHGFWECCRVTLNFRRWPVRDWSCPEALDESIVQRNLMGPTVRVFGRLKPGVSIESAAAQLQPLFRSFVESAPPPFRKELRLQVRSIRDLQIHDFRRAAWFLLISALAVLLIACANVANLVFARSTGRRHELAVRSALGAARVRLFRQRLTESMLLALVGGAIGCGLAYVIVDGFVALSPAGIPRLPEAAVNVRALIFALLSSGAAGVVFGTLPALEKAASGGSGGYDCCRHTAKQPAKSSDGGSGLDDSHSGYGCSAVPADSAQPRAPALGDEYAKHCYGGDHAGAAKICSTSTASCLLRATGTETPANARCRGGGPQ